MDRKIQPQFHSAVRTQAGGTPALLHFINSASLGVMASAQIW
jgi:hypothetical protein